MALEIKDLLKNSVPKAGACSGVYFLFDGDELIYIGSGWNCFLRVAEHTRKEPKRRIKFTSWSFMPIEGAANYREAERQLIQKYSPRDNIAHNRPPMRD